MDADAMTTIRHAEIEAAKTMLDRTAARFEVAPSRLIADAGYGSAEMIGWLVHERDRLLQENDEQSGVYGR